MRAKIFLNLIRFARADVGYRVLFHKPYEKISATMLLEIYVKKRLKSLDVTRGFAILAMVPFHVIVFGGLILGLFDTGGDGGGAGGEAMGVGIMEFDPPLATGLLLFFFVTGISLAVSFSYRHKGQSLFVIFRRVILRYGGYWIIGIVAEVVTLYVFLGQTDVLDRLVNILGGGGLTAPITGLALGAMIASPLIFKVAWKHLIAMSLVSAAILGVTLYFIVLPQSVALRLEDPSLLSLFLTGSFSILKGLPVILFGAAVGKLVVNGIDLKKMFLLIGGAICAVYIIVPTLLGTGMVHMILVIWTYHHAFIFIVSAGVVLFALMWSLERRNVLNSLGVLGRLSFVTYYGHYMFDLALAMLIGFENLTGGHILGIMIASTVVIWLVLYLYGRWRWGLPSTWYEPA